jgi:signal transduction histidine kinase
MPQVSARWRGARFWLRILAANLFAAVMIVLVFADATPRQWIGHWRAFAVSVAISFMFALCIAPLVGYLMPRLAPLVWRRLPTPFNWFALVAVMIVCALVGNAIAVSILVAIGFAPPARWLTLYEGSMRISVVVTLTIGVFITAYEMNRARLAQATAQAQLASLESRVQPHFLFNTLNSIAALTHEDPAGAERMTTQLASLLRSSLDTQSPLVPLADELALVRSYLEIERVRFGDRLRYEIGEAAANADARVPRMAVQTLVENSVKYAVSPRREGARIEVLAARVDGRLHVTVGDDGPGFDTAHLPDGHGLAMLRDRLAAQFAGRASLRIDGTAGATHVVLDLPIEPSAAGRPPTCTP